MHLVSDFTDYLVEPWRMMILITGLFNLSRIIYSNIIMKLAGTINNIIKTVILKDSRIGHLYLSKQSHSKYDIDTIINDIIYVLKTGVSWRALRSPIHWQSVYYHFKRFVKMNIFTKLFKMIRNKFISKNNKVLIIDSSFIGNKNGKNLLSRNKYYKNKNCAKLSCVTDINGLPLSIIVNRGTIHDTQFFNRHLLDIPKQFHNIILLGDKGYVSKKIRNELSKYDSSLMTLNKSNMIVRYPFNKALYKKRIRVENTFQKFKANKRIQLRYDSYHSTYLSFVYLAATIILFKKL